MARKNDRSAYGWGINDVTYSVTRTEVVNGKQVKVWVCPYYRKWRGIIERCYDSNYQETHPTYVGCTICEEWKYFSNFIKWVDNQPNKDWINCHPDKDLLTDGNKCYSPETVVFVSREVNSFILNKSNARGDYLIGVSFSYNSGRKNPYEARCSNPFGGSGYIGTYPTELEAHLAWKAKKHEHACALADLQEDERVAKRLREMYGPDTDWTTK